MKSVIRRWIPFLALISPFVASVSSSPSPPSSDLAGLSYMRDLHDKSELDIIPGSTPTEISPKISKRRHKSSIQVGGIPPDQCDGIYHHLCCMTFRGHADDDNLLAFNCLQFSEIAWVNQKNLGVMKGGMCNHPHFCCERIGEYRTWLYMLRRPRSVAMAEGCKIIWRPAEWDEVRDRREPSE